MSDSLKDRISSTLLITVLLFMFSAVVWKVVGKRVEWLQISLFLSISWGIGHFLRKTINEYRLNKNKEIDIKLTLILCCSIIIFFVTGVILEMPDTIYKYNICAILNFSVSLFQGKS